MKVIGISLSISSLWIGSFAMSMIQDSGHWAEFPIFMTAAIGIVCGLFIFAEGLHK